MSSRSSLKGLSARNHDIARLNANVERTLWTYTAVATTAGVSLLALARPSEAKVIFTPTHQLVSGGLYNLDLNGDGITDFTFMHSGANLKAETGSRGSGGRLSVTGALFSNKVIASQGQFEFPIPLSSKAQVGPSANFVNRGTMEVCLQISGNTVVDNGLWIGARNKFLGLRFKIQGQTHFGWARLSQRRAGCAISAVLTGYAYETVANRPITTGKQGTEVQVLGSTSENSSLASLGQLAQGASALEIRRRRED